MKNTSSSLLNKISGVSVLLFLVGIGSWVSFFFALNKLPWDIFISTFLYFLGVTQGVIVIAVLLRICTARWSGVFYRLAATVAMSYFPIAIAMLISIIFFKNSIFYWAEESLHHPWYNSFFFMGRTILPLLAFYAVAWKIFRQSIDDKSTAHANSVEESAKTVNGRQVMLGFLLLLTFVISQTLLSWDLAMTLDHGFADTIYSVLFMGSSILCGIAALILLMSLLKNGFGVNVFTPEHFSNMGQLLLGLTIVVFYFRWSQFFTIWFGNIPEETGAFYLRIFSQYKLIYVAMIFMTIVIPFFGLIFKKIRNSEQALIGISALILIGFWAERYLLVAPALVHAEKVINMFILNPINILFTLGILGGLSYMLFYLLSKNPEVVSNESQDLTGDILIVKAEGWQ